MKNFLILLSATALIAATGCGGSGVKNSSAALAPSQLIASNNSSTASTTTSTSTTSSANSGETETSSTSSTTDSTNTSTSASSSSGTATGTSTSNSTSEPPTTPSAPAAPTEPSNPTEPTEPTEPTAGTSTPTHHHIFLIAEENTSYNNVIGNNSQMPYLNSLVPKGTIWKNYYANAHGSMLAYIETVSGQTFNCSGNDCGVTPLTGDSLMNVMNNNGMTWKGYFDGLKNCGQLASPNSNWVIYPDSNGGNYYQRHVPFPWYAVGTATIANCSNNKSGWWPMGQLITDLANKSVGAFNWISPDGANDGHDTGPPQEDAFMKKYLTQLLASSYFQPGGDGILIIWYDEADLDDFGCGGPDGKSCGGQLPMLVIGPGILTDNVDYTPANHDSALRFIQEQLGLTPILGNSVNVPDFTNTLEQ